MAPDIFQRHTLPFPRSLPDFGGQKMELPSKHWRYPEQHGNLRGWRQYRKMLPNECARDI